MVILWATLGSALLATPPAAAADTFLLRWQEQSPKAGAAGDVRGTIRVTPGQVRLDGYLATGGEPVLSLVFQPAPAQLQIFNHQAGTQVHVDGQQVVATEVVVRRQLGEVEQMSSTLEEPKRAEVLAKAAAYGAYLEGYSPVTARATGTAQVAEHSCQVYELARAGQAIEEVCAVAPEELGLAPWVPELLAQMTDLSDRAVRMHRLSASIERGELPPADQDVNAYAALAGSMPLRRWRTEQGQVVWEWRLLDVSTEAAAPPAGEDELAPEVAPLPSTPEPPAAAIAPPAQPLPVPTPPVQEMPVGEIPAQPQPVEPPPPPPAAPPPATPPAPGANVGLEALAQARALLARLNAGLKAGNAEVADLYADSAEITELVPGRGGRPQQLTLRGTEYKARLRQQLSGVAGRREGFDSPLYNLRQGEVVINARYAPGAGLPPQAWRLVLRPDASGQWHIIGQGPVGQGPVGQGPVPGAGG